MDPARRVAPAPKVSCVYLADPPAANPGGAAGGAALALSGRLCRRCLKILSAEPGCRGPNGAGVGLIAAVLLGKGVSARLGARPVCHLWRAADHSYSALRFARRHLSTSRLLAGVALGIICSALMTWASLLLHLFDLRQQCTDDGRGFGGVGLATASWLMIALLPVLCWVCLQSQTPEFTGAGRSLRSSAWAAAVAVAQITGGGDRLDGRR